MPSTWSKDKRIWKYVLRKIYLFILPSFLLRPLPKTKSSQLKSAISRFVPCSWLSTFCSNRYHSAPTDGRAPPSILNHRTHTCVVCRDLVVSSDVVNGSSVVDDPVGLVAVDSGDVEDSFCQLWAPFSAVVWNILYNLDV
ncbi:unnamed protein product [Caenorhabditis nigoni]